MIIKNFQERYILKFSNLLCILINNHPLVIQAEQYFTTGMLLGQTQMRTYLSTQKFHLKVLKQMSFLIWSSEVENLDEELNCLLYTSPSPRDRQKSRMPSSA
eukprot:TRINITY_DN44655_c0_g1_i1.p2 TRINITY_DN44655_c0_g1~~TRINITY_DN44655_c0_g1_i1.p2  ORF type:complete len:102 (-),score=10.96 TRINITY_DN44655_c0_g1_i1:29-334(-)